MTEFKGQVNPTGTIHNPPPSVPSVNRLTGGQIGAFGTIIVDLILAQVAMALGGVDIFGIKPFAFLTQWAEDLQQQAVDAYKNSFAVVDVVNQNPVGTTTSGTLNQIYSAAAVVNSTATTASQNADTANGNVQTTWTALWDASKGNTGAPSANKTVADVKAAVGEVRNTGITADGKAQDTIDGVYSAVMGGTYTGMPANYVKPVLTGLTYTARNNVASGSNLVIDPGGENSSYWTQTGVAQNTNSTYVRTGSKSVSLTSAGSTSRTLFFNTIDTGAVQPYFVRQSEIYYVECYVKAASSIGTVHLVAQPNGSSTVSDITSASVTSGIWIKLSGQYVVPVGVNTASFGIAFGAGEVTANSVVYVDDMLVREITNAQLAQTNVESTWDAIYNGVYDEAFTGITLSGVRGSLYLTKQTADGGLSAAGTAQTAAEGAQGAAERADGKALTADELAILAASQNNLVISPFFDNIKVRRVLDYTTNGLFTGEYSAEQSVTGTYSYKVTMTAAGTSSNYGGVNLNTAPVGGTLGLKWPVVPGQVYNYDLMVYSKSTNTSSKQLALFGGFTTIASPAGVAYGALTTPKSQVKGSWDHWTGTFTIPSLVNGNVPLSLYLDFGFINGAVGATGEAFYLGRALIYQ